MNDKLKIFLPSSGSLSVGAIDFFNNCGIKIIKESDRKLVGKIKDAIDLANAVSCQKRD